MFGAGGEHHAQLLPRQIHRRPSVTSGYRESKE
jgi:hypothetical protein